MAEEKTEQQKTKEDNLKRLYASLAISLGLMSASDVDFDKGVPKKIISAIDKMNASLPDSLPIDVGSERLSEADIITKAATLRSAFGPTLFKVKTAGDEKVCDLCKAWQDEVLTLVPDGRHKLVSEFTASDGLHYNCRCALEPVEQIVSNTMKIPMKELNKMAMNTSIITDEPVYRGFLDEGKEDLVTYDFGSTLVKIAPIGTFKGYNAGSNEAVDETIDNTSLDNIIKNYDGNELLVDFDHKSMKDPMQRDTTAAGWASELVAIKDAGDIAGLYCRIKWTDEGRQAVESRKYRFLSPTFQLDEDNRPMKLLNIGLTNKPAFTTLPPILNTEATTQEDISKEYLDMTKEELVDIVNSCIDEKMKALNACGDDEKKNEVANETAVEEATEEKTDVETKVDDVVEDIVEEKTEAEETKDEDKSDDDPAEEEKEELIKEEVLNTAPTGVEQKFDNWKNLRGKDFTDWLEKHPKGI